MPLRDDDSRDLYPDSPDHDSWDEAPDPRDIPAPDDFTTVPCTRCKKLIFEDVKQCPYCKHWQMADEHFLKPRWFIATVIFCILAVLLWLFGRFL